MTDFFTLTSPQAQRRVLGPNDAQVWFSLLNHTAGYFEENNDAMKSRRYVHGGKDTLYDVAGAISGQFESLGMRCGASDDEIARSPVQNIVFEAWGPGSDEFLRGLRESDHILNCVFTETPGRRGKPFSNALNNMNRKDMFERAAAWPKASKYFDRVFCLVPEATDWLRQFNDNVAHIELGFAPTRLVRWLKAEQPIYDFVFFGSKTPRRQNIIKAFESKGFTFAPVDEFAPIPVRNQAIRLSKIGLGIKGLKGWSIHSNSRYCTLLHAGRAVCAESLTGLPTFWSKIITVVPPSQFIDAAAAMLDNYEAEWGRQIEAYNELLSPEKNLLPALIATGWPGA